MPRAYAGDARRVQGVCWENGGRFFPVDEGVGVVVRDNWVEVSFGGEIL